MKYLSWEIFVDLPECLPVCDATDAAEHVERILRALDGIPNPTQAVERWKRIEEAAKVYFGEKHPQLTHKQHLLERAEAQSVIKEALNS